MQQLELDIIGTHLHIQIDTSSSCDEDFSHIRSYLTDFESRFSRFIDGNWLADINKNRVGILDEDAEKMLEFMLEMSKKTGGYFDPTVGKRLTELGYGNREIKLPDAKGEIGYGDYRDIEVRGYQIVLHGNSILEFGGVGKGYLIDVIREIIDGCVDCGIPQLQTLFEGEWCRFSPGKGGVRGGYTEYNPSLLQYAKENRKNTNDMEKNMWFLLRGEKLGYKFHRQKPIGEYIADFYSPSLQLVIEIDGESHTQKLSYDTDRTDYLNALGLHVLRFTNIELSGDLEGVQENIRSWIEKVKDFSPCNPSQPPLFRGGAERYLINFGGDMYGRGGWTVGLESPFAADEVIGTIILDNQFLACSAGTRRKWANHHHLIDPHTGESAEGVIATYIEGSSGMVCDAYATVLCVMPWELACTTLEKTSEISGVIVSKDGYIYQKNGSQAQMFGY